MSAVTIETIFSAVETASGVAKSEILSDRQSSRESVARFTVWWLARRFTEMSIRDIGRATNRDEASVHHGLRRVADLRQSDPVFLAGTDALVAALTVIERQNLSLRPAIDPIAVATRIAARPEREAVRVSTEDIIAMARELIALHGAQTQQETDHAV